jgi:UDP-N-acetylmuramyl pentapeptide phosphotransferase/UDP-N-acetylglucosamine-1-phosphate transferase
VAGTADVANPIAAAPAIGFTILLIPLLDTLRVFSIRIFYRRSPFSPDRNHIHHLLLDRGLSHRAITIILVAFNFSLIALVYSCRSLGCTLLIFSVLALFFSFIGVIYSINSRRPQLSVAKSVNGSAENVELKPASKIVSFVNENVFEQKN